MPPRVVSESQRLRPRRSACTPGEHEIQGTIQMALERLSQSGYRKTPLLRTVLAEMATHHSPVTLKELMSMPSIGDCDPSSAFRLIKRLETEGIVTRLGMAHKAHYLLVMPGHRHAYLVCKICGFLEEANFQPTSPTICTDCEFAPWSQVEPEFCFTGICPDCT